jgi:gliding motility-associated-like protein/uncharacterized repeat protein (TIGR01451 family)
MFMNIKKFVVVGLLGSALLSSSYAQNTNKGQITMLPGTVATAVDEFVNSSSGTLFNDGEFYMYSNLSNDGNFGFTSLSEGKSFAYFNSKTQIQKIEGKSISYFNNIVFENEVQKNAFKLDGRISIAADAFFKKGVVEGMNNLSTVIFEKGGLHAQVSDNSHVQGYVQTNDGNMFTYPTGDGGYFRYAKLEPNKNRNSYRVKYYYEPVGDLFPDYKLASDLKLIDDAEVWEVQSLQADQSARLTLSWRDVTTPPFILGETSSKLVIVHYDEVKNEWVNLGGVSNASLMEISSSEALNQTGYFTLGVLGNNAGTNLSISKTSFGRKINVGDVFMYEIVVENNSSVDAYEVMIVDNLPFNLFFDKVEYQSVLGNDKIKHTVLGNTITWTIPVLLADDRVVIKLFVKAQDEGNTINIASVSSKTEDIDLSDNEDSDEALIGKLFIPNFFTPNGDGENDLFVINGIDEYEKAELEIANRWGDQVYKSANYNNDWAGIGLPEGTYFYMLKLFSNDGESKDYKGWVQIIREKID